MQTNRPDQPHSDYELVIIGGGCSGLSLAAALCRLAVQPEDVPRTLIVEPRSRYTSDRSWCFWAEANQDNQARPESHVSQAIDIAGGLITRSWRAWEFSAESVSHRHTSGGGWNYHYVPSIRFYEKVEEQLAENPNITLLKDARVSEAKPNENCIALRLESGLSGATAESRKVTAGQIVDTRIPENVDVASAVLKQVLFGLEVRLQSPHRFDDVARVMDDMRVDNEGFMFDYVLPLDRHSLLVEFTRFATELLPPESLRLDALESVRRVCGDSGFQIVREESGVIPMGLSDGVGPTDPRWIHTGLGAGAARPSTGYAFTRIQRWAEICAAGILKDGKGQGFPPDRPLLTWMDKVFLRTIASNPALAPQLFMSLAGKVHPDRLLRFLTDRPGNRDLLAVMLALPKLPLIRCAFAETYAGIVTANRSHTWHEVLSDSPGEARIQCALHHRHRGIQCLVTGKRRGPASDIRHAAGIDRPASRCRRPGNRPTGGSVARGTGLLKFSLGYLALSVAVVGVWFVLPELFIVPMLAFSAWHFPATGSAMSVGYRVLPSAPLSSHCQLCSIQQRCSLSSRCWHRREPDYCGRHGAHIRRQLAHGGLLLFQDAGVECHLAGGTGCFVLCRLCPAAHCLLYRLLLPLTQPASS